MAVRRLICLLILCSTGNGEDCETIGQKVASRDLSVEDGLRLYDATKACDAWSEASMYSAFAIRCGLVYGGDTDCDRESMLQKAVSIKPDWSQLRRNLAYFLEQQDRIDDAARVLDRDTDIGSVIASAALCPPHTFSLEEPGKRYRELVQTMHKALLLIDASTQKEDGLSLLASMPIAWPYLGYDVKPLMTLFGLMLRKVSEKSSLSLLPRTRQRNTPRVVIVAELSQNTSPGLLFEHILLGLCNHMELFFVAPQDLDTDFVQKARATCPHIVHLPTTSSIEAATVLYNLEADIILYLALGLSLLTYTTAMMRLAPIQLAFGHGHPITSGLPTIDYFISSTLFQSDQNNDLKQDYIEQEVLFETPTSGFTKPKAYGLSRRDALNLFRAEADESSPLFVCLQHSKKLHPNFDRVLKAVLDAVPTANIAMLQGTRKHIPRWQRAGLRIERILFLPRAPREAVLALTATADAFLDTFPWGGGVTVLEALALCTPVIILPRNTSVLQLAQAYLSVSDLSQFLVANDVAHYAAIAARLAHDPAFRLALRHRACNSAPLLYPPFPDEPLRSPNDNDRNDSLFDKVLQEWIAFFGRLHRMGQFLPLP